MENRVEVRADGPRGGLPALLPETLGQVRMCLRGRVQDQPDELALLRMRK
jgi:hypothetical protein